ncbi:MAG: hypothetical protein M3478_13280, partial [Planctomycetota bacterium]|nr:hypothetical protein [Planctomycetota bacterium]
PRAARLLLWSTMNRMGMLSGRGTLIFALILGAGGIGLACQEHGVAERADASAAPATTTQRFAKFTSPSTKPFAPLTDQEGLHNSHIVTDKIISGAQPEHDKSFALLRELGVKTIVSVDGSQPDVESAKRYGMRYVHLPIGYDGVDEAEGKAIAKALTELPGPIYVHCHHGRHRSAAAVAVACVNNGMLQPEQAEDVLKTFGTGANYTGLWKAARDAERIDDKELAQLQIKWVEQAKIPELADAMIKVDHHHDHLKLIQKAGWKAPSDHPDLAPAHEALQLQEHFTEMARTDDTKARPADYRKSLTESEQNASKLREALAANPVDTMSADTALKAVSTSCTTCHKSYRDSR